MARAPRIGSLVCWAATLLLPASLLCAQLAIPEVQRGRVTTTVRGALPEPEPVLREPAPLSAGDFTGAMLIAIEALGQPLQGTEARPFAEPPLPTTPATLAEAPGDTENEAENEPEDDFNFFDFLLQRKGDEQDEAQDDDEPPSTDDLLPSPNIPIGEIVHVDTERGFAVAWLLSRQIFTDAPLLTRNFALEDTAIVEPAPERANRSLSLHIRWGTPQPGDTLYLPGPTKKAWLEARLSPAQ